MASEVDVDFGMTDAPSPRSRKSAPSSGAMDESKDTSSATTSPSLQQFMSTPSTATKGSRNKKSESKQRLGSLVGPKISDFDANARYSELIKQAPVDLSEEDREFVRQYENNLHTAKRLAREGLQQTAKLYKIQAARSQAPGSVNLDQFRAQQQQLPSSDRKDNGPAAPEEKDVESLVKKMTREFEKDEEAGRPRKIQKTGIYQAVGTRRGREDVEAKARESVNRLVEQQLSEQAEVVKSLIQLMQMTEMEVKNGANQIAMDTKDIPAPTLAALKKLSIKLTDDLKTMKMAREAAEAAATKAQGEARALQTKLNQSEATSNDAITKVNRLNEGLTQDIESLKAIQLTLRTDLQKRYDAELERVNNGHAAIVQGLRDSLETEHKTSSGLQTRASKAEAAVTVLDSVKNQLGEALGKNRQLEADLARAADEQGTLQRRHDEEMSALRVKFRGDLDKETKELAMARNLANDNKQQADVAMKEVASLRVALEEKTRAMNVKDVPPMTFYVAFRTLLEKGSMGLFDIRYPLGLDPLKKQDDFAQLLKQHADNIRADSKGDISRLQEEVSKARTEAMDAKEQAERSAAEQKAAYARLAEEQRATIKTLREQNLGLDNSLAVATDAATTASATIESFRQTQAVLEQRLKAAERKSLSAQEELIKAQTEISATRTKLDGLTVTSTETEAVRKRLEDELKATIQQSEVTGHTLAEALAGVERMKTEIATLNSKIKSRDQTIEELTKSSGILFDAVSRQSTAAANRQGDTDTKQTGSIIDQTKSLVDQAEQIEKMTKKIRLLQDDYDGFVAITDVAVSAIDKVKWKAMYPNPFHPYQPPVYTVSPPEWAHSVFAACSDKVFGDMLADALGDKYTPWIPLHAHVTAVLHMAESEEDMKNNESAKFVMLTVFSILMAYHIIEERVRAHVRSPADNVQPLAPLTEKERISPWNRVRINKVVEGVIHGCMHAAANRARIYGDRLTDAIGKSGSFPSLSSSESQRIGNASIVLQEQLRKEEFCRALVRRIRKNTQLQLFWRYDGNPMDIIQSMLSLPEMREEIQETLTETSSFGQRR